MSDKSQSVVHVVVLSAGHGTRFLPITKSVPKKMLPVVNRSSIEYIMREATDVGIEDILFVTRAGKQSIEDYFDTEPDLEANLEKAGREKALEYVNEYKKYVRVHSVRQGHPLGLGHAILQAKSHVGDAPCAVLLPGDLMEPRSQPLRKMIQVRDALGGTIVALLRVIPEQATAYASTAAEVLPIPEGASLEEDQLMHITDVTKKPPFGEIKSKYAVIGRYLLDSVVSIALENIEPGAGSEYQLTDGYARMIDLPGEEGGGLYGVVINERRFGTGDKLDYPRANVTLALENPTFGAKLKELLCSKLEG